jgi:putative hydrolase of the HAD superfamily
LSNITAIFFDLGGVLLTNAWDQRERAAAVAHFQLDSQEFQRRHQLVVSAFERGEITLDEYLDQTVVFTNRRFSRQAFKDFVFSQSQADVEALDIARQLKVSRKYLMSTINNESTELNLYRIQKFHLREIFDVFLSSCFVGLQKPDPRIYRLALNVTQRPAEQCCFVDDRPENLEPARQLGMNTILMKRADQLRQELKKLGVG